jgi:L-lactate utilization protein LutC
MSGQRAASSSSPELDQMMQRIRRALRDQRDMSYPKVDRAVLEHDLPDDQVAAFTERAQAVGMHVHRGEATAIEVIVRSIVGVRPGTAVVDRSLLESLPNLAAGMALRTEPTQDELFNADLSIVQMQGAIAATGSVIRTSGPDRPRAFALVPPLVIGVLHARDILRDLIDWFERDADDPPPTDVTFITGPSKTADIGMQLVTGIHGPGEVHIIITSDHLRA